MRNTCVKILEFASKQRCDREHNLTPIIFYDPVSQKSETIYNCQQHSDAVFRPIMGVGSDYAHLQNLIEVASGKKHDGTIYGNEMDFQTDKNAESKLSKLYDVRSTMTWKICRLPNCQHKKELILKETLRGTKFRFFGATLDKEVFTVLPFGQNGRNRHQLYFHEDCANTLKRMLGIMQFPEPQTQLLTVFTR